MKKTFLILLILFLQREYGVSQAKTSIGINSIKITINIKDAQQPDSVSLYFYDGAGGDRNYPSRKYALKRDASGIYGFLIAGIEHPSHFSLFLSKDSHSYPQFLMNHFLCEPGDDVTIGMKNNPDVSRPIFVINYYLYQPYNHKVVNGFNSSRYEPLFEFSGRGSAKYNCRYERDKKAITFISNIGFPVDKQGHFVDSHHSDSAKQAAMEIIEKYKSQLSTPAYQILQADADADFERERIAWFKNYNASSHSFSDTSYFGNAYRSYITKLRKSSLRVSLEAKTRSFNFATYAAEYYYYFKAGIFSNRTNVNIPQNVINVYDSIKVYYSGELRDKILTAYLKLTYQNILSRTDEGMAVVRNALETIKTLNCLSELNDFMGAYSKNVKAYDFSLPDVYGNMVRLSDYQGKVVFIDFWFTGCKPCAMYYKNIVAPVEARLKFNKDVVFITIGLDGDKQKWLNSVEKDIYTSPKVVNLYTEGKAYDHPVSKFYRVTGAPRPILIGRNGYVYSNDKDLRASPEVLQKTIEAALAEK